MWTVVCPPRTAGRTRRCTVMSVLFLSSPFPLCSFWLCWTVTHTHTHLHMNRHEGSHLRHREGTCASKEGGEEEQYKDRKWLVGAVPRELTNRSRQRGVLQVIHTCNSPWPILFWVFIQLQTPFPPSGSLTFSLRFYCPKEFSLTFHCLQ